MHETRDDKRAKVAFYDVGHRTFEDHTRLQVVYLDAIGQPI